MLRKLEGKVIWEDAQTKQPSHRALTAFHNMYLRWRQLSRDSVVKNSTNSQKLFFLFTMAYQELESYGHGFKIKIMSGNLAKFLNYCVKHLIHREILQIKRGPDSVYDLLYYV